MFSKAIFSAVAVAGLILGTAAAVAAPSVTHRPIATAATVIVQSDTSWGDNYTQPVPTK
ncbi:hypothetical protein ABH930_003541 [Kitasatospora sp. GAS204A]|nr:hypothetical protein [Kitasatospora sp. GAS204B]